MKSLLPYLALALYGCSLCNAASSTHTPRIQKSGAKIKRQRNKKHLENLSRSMIIPPKPTPPVVAPTKTDLLSSTSEELKSSRAETALLQQALRDVITTLQDTTRSKPEASPSLEVETDKISSLLEVNNKMLSDFFFMRCKIDSLTTDYDALKAQMLFLRQALNQTHERVTKLLSSKPFAALEVTKDHSEKIEESIISLDINQIVSELLQNPYLKGIQHTIECLKIFQPYAKTKQSKKLIEDYLKVLLFKKSLVTKQERTNRLELLDTTSIPEDQESKITSKDTPSDDEFVVTPEAIPLSTTADAYTSSSSSSSSSSAASSTAAAPSPLRASTSWNLFPAIFGK